MPVYEYSCAHCGDFTALRAIRERDEPLSCPDCETPATRLILTAPASFLGDAPNRKAHERNERAAHEPRRRSSQQMQPSGSEPPAKPQFKRADCGRPWMIGH